MYTSSPKPILHRDFVRRMKSKTKRSILKHAGKPVSAQRKFARCEFCSHCGGCRGILK